MVKLLDFKPDSTLRKLIEDDVWMSCTPDMPTLRYSDKIPVFIWDELNMVNGLEKNIGVDSSDYRVVDYMVRTKDNFLPFFNQDSSRGSNSRNILPASPTWNKSIKESENKVHINSRPVIGKYVEVNLFTLRLLDVFYSNTISHQRRIVTVLDAKGKEKQAWLYAMPTNVFTKYDPHDNVYRLVSGFRPTGCPIVKFTTSGPEGDFSYRVPT